MRHLVLAAALGAFALVPGPPPATASCAAPALAEVPPDPLEPGAELRIEGRSFVDGCRDSHSCTAGLGCSHCRYDEPAERPLRHVDLRLVRAGRSWDLGSADAGTGADGRLGQVTWVVRLPVGIPPGPAQLVAGPAAPVAVRIG